MRVFALSASFACLVLFLGACKNQNSTKTADASSGPAATANPDTMVGFTGMNRAAFKMIDTANAEFTYQRYVIRTSRRTDGKPGDVITVVPTDGTPAWAAPVPVASFFNGVVQDRLIVDIGTGPDGRALQVINLQTHLVNFTTKYVGDPQVLSGNKLWFLAPVLADTLTKKPECPQQADWEKNGLKVGYGQRCIFDLANRQLTRKSEFQCVAVQ